MMKKCIVCGIEFLGGRPASQLTCSKLCAVERRRQRNRANMARKKAADPEAYRRSYANEKVRKYQREYMRRKRAENPDYRRKQIEYTRAYYRANVERLRKYAAEKSLKHTQAALALKIIQGKALGYSQKRSAKWWRDKEHKDGTFRERKREYHKKWKENNRERYLESVRGSFAKRRATAQALETVLKQEVNNATG